MALMEIGTRRLVLLLGPLATKVARSLQAIHLALSSSGGEFSAQHAHFGRPRTPTNQNGILLASILPLIHVGPARKTGE